MKKKNNLVRWILPVLLAATLLAAGLLLFTSLIATGNGDSMIWFWPLILAVFFFTWAVLRGRLGEHVSPQVFLFASVPVLVLLMAATILLPSLSMDPVVEAREKETLDLSGDFLYTLEGEKVSLEDFAGKVTFINFWATWCAPCRAEMPSMANLFRELERDGLRMVAISDEDPDIVRSYLEKEPYPFVILLDPNGKLFRRWKVFALPTTYVVGKDSEVLLEHQGGFHWYTPKLVERFRNFLSE